MTVDNFRKNLPDVYHGVFLEEKTQKYEKLSPQIFDTYLKSTLNIKNSVFCGKPGKRTIKNFSVFTITFLFSPVAGLNCYH